MAGIPPGANYLEYGGSGGNGYGGGLFVSPGTSTAVNNTFQNDSSGGGSANPEPRIFPTILPMSRVDMTETEPAARSAAIPLSCRTTISLEMLP